MLARFGPPVPQRPLTQVSGICEGTSILSSPAQYAVRSTAYLSAGPAIGAMLYAINDIYKLQA